MRSQQRPHRAVVVISLLGLLTAALYGLISLNYPWHILRQELSLSNQLLVALVSRDFVLGDTSIGLAALRNYTRAFAGISMHTVLGGLSLCLCALQFIPALRRRAPALHRAVGKLAVLSICAAMVGAMVYLGITPAHEVFSGEPFAVALWVQAVSTLMTLGLAIKAIRERHIRAHMGWMALLFAGLLTAPLLRIEYIAVGHLLPHLNIAQANAGLAVILFPQVVWLMAWWMLYVGRTDLPLLTPHPTLHWPALRIMGWLGAATVLHEGLLAPWGLDGLSPWRTAAERLPVLAGLWALASALLLPRIHAELRAVLRQQAIGHTTLWLGVAASMGALLTASQLPAGDYNQIGRQFYWAGAGIMGLLISVSGMVWRQTGPAHTPVRVLSLMSWLMPAMWAPMAWALSWTGWPAGAVLTATLTLCAGLFAWHGFASAFGLPMPGVPAPTPQTGETAA